MKTIATAKQLLQLKDDFLDPLTMLPTADLANEGIISTLIILLHSDALIFCDVVGNLSEITMSTAVDEIRNGKLYNRTHLRQRHHWGINIWPL